MKTMTNRYLKTSKMPLLSREGLAYKLRQNWIAKHPMDIAVNQTGLDDSLTSLNWLQNLNIMKITTPTPPSSPPPTSNQPTNKQLRVNPNSVLNMANIAPIKHELSTISIVPCPSVQETVNPPTTNNLAEAVDYKTNPYVKPPYSYATLICMAMKESKKNKITLAGIYTWITDNFMYYRVADPSWQNSIRHNLSLNKCFQKVPRRKDEPGKGGFWRINPEYMDMLENGILKKRRASLRETIVPSPPLKRLKSEPEDFYTMQPSCSKTRTDLVTVKTEPGITDSRYLNVGDVGEGLDFSWSSILNQDIDVGGIKIKTEDIINESAAAANTITSMSPPPSDSSSDVSLDDLLSADFATPDADMPMDLTTGNNLDLTIQGTNIKPPEWWAESFNSGKGLLQLVHSVDQNGSGLNTPMGTSPIHETECEPAHHHHPWAEDKTDLDQAIAAFDLDNLFPVETHMPSPKAVDS